MNIQVDLIEEDNLKHFKIIGEIDAFTAPKLKEKIDSVSNLPNIKVEIDLTAVAYIDSTGLGVFVGCYKSLLSNGSELKIMGVNSRLKRLFEITGLDGIMDIETKDGEV